MLMPVIMHGARAVVAAALFLPAGASAGRSSDPVYDPLWLYNGTWVATSKPGDKRDTIANECARVGTYFACQQTVNGKLAALVVFLPLDKQGHYATQGVDVTGAALGRGKLEIVGDHWTYDGEDRSGDSTVYYRTTNTFSGHDRIHFELATSKDGRTWTVTREGDEERQLK